MKNYNLIWIVIDSVRSYRSGKDDRDRLDIMDQFGNEGLEFTNAFTTAPSSVLAASTMFTGLPSCYISRHYNDFIFDSKEIDSLQNILKNSGFHIYSIFDAKACRDALQTMTHALSAKFYPPKITHDEWWPNREITNILEHIFKKNMVTLPGFFLLWYNCRLDPNTSFEVKRALKIFKDNGIYDNSIIVMCSDHGYPDPHRGLSKETMKKFGHDMIVTDDNIRIPLFLKYPKCNKNQKIDSVVSTTDLFPTILQLMDIPIIKGNMMNYQCKYRGKSLLNLINKKDSTQRVARIDTRLGFAFGRVTALRTDKYKYVYYCENDKEHFYDMLDDPYEINNLIESKNEQIRDEISKFRLLLHNMDESIYNYHYNQLDKKLHDELTARFSYEKMKKHRRLLITCSRITPLAVVKTLVCNLKKHFINASLNAIIEKSVEHKYDDAGFSEIFVVNKFCQREILMNEVLKDRYGVVIYISENSRKFYIDSHIINMLKKIKGSEFLMLDYNFKIYTRLLSKWVAPFLRLYQQNRRYYRGEPILFIKDTWKLLKDGVMINYLKNPNITFDSEDIKIMGDKQVKVFKGENPFIKDRKTDAEKREKYENEFYR